MGILKINKQLGTKGVELNIKQREYVFNTASHILFGGGTGAGKTVALVYRTLMMVRLFPGILILVGRQTFPSLRDTTMVTFREMLGELGWKYNYKVAQQDFEFGNGSRLMFRYLDGFQPRQGLSLGGLAIDQIEEVKEDVFNVLLTRLRQQVDPVDPEKEPQFGHLVSAYGTSANSWLRKTWHTCNMVSEDHWIFRVWKVNEERRKINHPKHNPRFYLVEAPTDVNKMNLPPDYFDSLSDMPQDMIDRYRWGVWGGASGKIYSDLWRDELHLIDSNTPFPADAEFYRAYDHGGMADAGCVLFYYYSKNEFDGELEAIIFDLYWGEKQTISQHARNILKLWQDLDFHLTLADPQVKHRTQQSTTKEENISLLDVYRANGLYLTPAFRPVFAGIDKVRVWMNVNAKHPHRFLKGPDGKPLMGAPHMYVHRHLWRLIEQIKSGHYSEKKPGALAQTVDDARTAMRFGLASPVSYRGAEPVDKRVFTDSLSQVVATELDEMEDGIDESSLDPYYLETD